MLISICVFSCLFIMPVIILDMCALIILSTNIRKPYSLSLFLAHKREKISLGVACIELSFLEIIFTFLQSLIHRLKD